MNEEKGGNRFVASFFANWGWLTFGKKILNRACPQLVKSLDLCQKNWKCI